MPPSPTRPSSANFAFLAVHDPLLDHLGALAERYFAEDPSTSLVKLRQFGEVLAQRAAANAGMYTSSAEQQIDLLARLRDAGLLAPNISDLFHGLRRSGNAAAGSRHAPCQPSARRPSTRCAGCCHGARSRPRSRPADVVRRRFV